jgi:hypothetical protein
VDKLEISKQKFGYRRWKFILMLANPPFGSIAGDEEWRIGETLERVNNFEFADTPKKEFSREDIIEAFEAIDEEVDEVILGASFL